MKKRNRGNRRRVIGGILLGLLVVGGILCTKRWGTWFYNHPEPAYVLNNAPQRLFLTFGNDGEWSRNVSWICGGVSRKAKLEYTQIGSGDTLRVDGNSKFLRTRGGYGYANWAKFTRLVAGNSYAYRVWNDDRSSDWHSFTMPSDSTRHFSFVFLGDVQDTLRGKSRELMQRVRSHCPQAEFYMFVGDFAERPMNQYWEEVYQSLDSIATQKPLIVAPGNHEYLKGAVRVIDERFPYAFSYLLQSKVDDNRVYAIDYKDATIVSLDSNRGFGFLLTQRRWLENVLKTSDKKWKIVMLHHPVYSIKGKMNNLTVRWMFDALFRKYAVDVVLQGHEHNYGRMTVKEENGRMTTPLYIVSHASPKNYRLELNDSYDRFGTGSKYYQYVDVKGDSLRMQAFMADGSLYDDVCIVKNQTGVSVVDFAQDMPEQLEQPWLKGSKAKAYQESIAKRKQRKLSCPKQANP